MLLLDGVLRSVYPKRSGGRVEFPVQPRAELQGLEDRSGAGQHGLHCVDRGPLGTFAKRPGECREDRVLVALRESWSPRPPVRVVGLTRFPGPQISETRRLWHQPREYERITVPSLLRARVWAALEIDGDQKQLRELCHPRERETFPEVPKCVARYSFAAHTSSAPSGSSRARRRPAPPLGSSCDPASAQSKCTHAPPSTPGHPPAGG